MKGHFIVKKGNVQIIVKTDLKGGIGIKKLFLIIFHSNLHRSKARKVMVTDKNFDEKNVDFRTQNPIMELLSSK